MTDGAYSSQTANRVLREPLVHFVLIGACLFGLFSWLAPYDEKSSRRILVTEERLLEFMQYRNQTFSDPAKSRLEELLSSMTPSQKSLLIEDYVREEVLHREALALGLNGSDYVIRRRLAQTMEYILRGTADEDLSSLDESELQDFFHDNLERYESPELVSLRHVFFDTPDGERVAERRAQIMLNSLRSEEMGFEAALARSDRFPYFNDYATETRPLIESHLGTAIADVAFGKTQTTSWQGPYRSREGLHLIQVSRRVAPKTPELALVRDIVINDWRNAMADERLEKRVRGLIGEYRVESMVP